MENKILKLNKGLSEEILISEGTKEEMEKWCKHFFDVIIKEIKSFDKHWSIVNEYWTKQKIDSENIYFESEKITKRSPLTIIDAPWGTGKTYFVEKLIQFFNKNLNQKDFFIKKIIFLDAWKYSISENPATELIGSILSAMENVYPNYKKKIDEWRNNENIEDGEYELGYHDLSKWNFPRTIIFLDNVERLGKDAWLILKSLWRMLEAKNFIFILPMNKNKIIELFYNDFGESSFEKYIDIKYFEFKQNYLHFLKNMKFNDKFSIILNELLETEIDGEKISIREAEKRIKSNNILDLSNKGKLYDTLLSFAKNIWGTNEKVRDYILEDINSFFLKWDKLKKIFEDVHGQVKLELKELLQFKQIIDPNSQDEDDTSLETFTSNWNFLVENNIFYEWEDDWKIWRNYIILSKGQIEKDIQNNDSKSEEFEKDKENESIYISKQQDMIQENEDEISKENNNHTPDHNKILRWKDAIKIFSGDIEKYLKNIELLNNKIKNIKENKNFLIQNLELLEWHNIFILEKISLYTNTKKEILKETREYKIILKQAKLLWLEEEWKHENYIDNNGNINDNFINEITNRILK